MYVPECACVRYETRADQSGVGKERRPIGKPRGDELAAYTLHRLIKFKEYIFSLLHLVSIIVVCAKCYPAITRHFVTEVKQNASIHNCYCSFQNKTSSLFLQMK